MGRSCLVATNTPGLTDPSFSRIVGSCNRRSGLVIGKSQKSTWKARIEVVTGRVLTTAKAVKHYSNRRLGEMLLIWASVYQCLSYRGGQSNVDRGVVGEGSARWCANGNGERQRKSGLNRWWLLWVDMGGRPL